MNYEEFEEKILFEIINNKNQCLDTIEDNKKLISIYLNDNEKENKTKNFVNKLNDVILNLKNFNLIEKVLNHELFANILKEFQNSDILIRACKAEKKDLIKWLLSMHVSTFVQDGNGMTALMYAVKSPKLDSLIETFVAQEEESLYLTDNNNETVLFHAITNHSSFKILLSLSKTTHIDLNHKNNNGETVLIYCCKYDIILPINNLIAKVDVDLDVKDNNDRNAAMYLIDHGRYLQLFILIKNKDRFDCNYKNRHQETLMTHLIQQFRKVYTSEYNSKTLFIKRIKLMCYSQSLIALNELGCDFNAPIDEDGNTPLMFFLKMGDNCSVYYILKNVENLDLSIKNKYGQSATTLNLNIDEPKKYLRKLFMDHKTFDYDYIDRHNNTLLNYFFVKGDSSDIENITCTLKERMIRREEEEEVNKKEKEEEENNSTPPNINPFLQINDNNESPIIIAVKLGHSINLTEDYFVKNSVNQQDNLGNTALYYAIKIKDRYAINLLRYYHADPHIKNKQGVSPLDLSIEMNDEGIKELLNEQPLPPEEFIEKENSNKNKRKHSLIKSMIKKNKDKGKKKEMETDRNIESYIQNYQINNYKNDYDFILKQVESDENHPILKIFFVKNNMWLIYSKQELLGSSSVFFFNNISLSDEVDEMDEELQKKINSYAQYLQMGTSPPRKFIPCPF